MDELTKEFHRFLVDMKYNPEQVNDKLKHYTEHLLSLLPADDADSVCHYYGVLENEQMSLAEIAKLRNQSEESAIEKIDNSLRRLAVSPEWQMMRTMIKETINKD